MKITDQLVNSNVNFVNNGSTDQRVSAHHCMKLYEFDRSSVFIVKIFLLAKKIGRNERLVYKLVP